MSYAADHPVRCAAADRGCAATYPGSKWGAIKAHADGWLIQQDGTSWCPDHLPAWVAAWRARRARRLRVR